MCDGQRRQQPCRLGARAHRDVPILLGNPEDPRACLGERIPGSVHERDVVVQKQNVFLTRTWDRRMYRGTIDTPKTHGSKRNVALPTSVVADMNEWRAISRNTTPVIGDN